ncbi:MAG: type VI secretion system lipoprotein TssJ [Kiloniellales bacterium]
MRFLSRRLWKVALVPLLAAALVSCGGDPPPPPPPPTLLNLTITAAPDVNPDPNGRASPIALRIYTLRAPGGLRSAEFRLLWDSEADVLGNDLVRRSALMLRPGEVRVVTAELPPDVNYIGLAAAYRDIGAAEWTGLVPVERNTTMQVYALLQSLRLWVTLAPPAPGPASSRMPVGSVQMGRHGGDPIAAPQVGSNETR